MKSEPDRHPAAADVERYSEGGLTKEECSRLEEHLLICADCRQRVREHDLYTQAMREAAASWQATRQTAERPWFYPRLFPLAAALLLVALAGALWIGRVSFRQAAPAFAVTLQANRGLTAGAHAPAGRPLEVKADLTGLAAYPHYDLRVVNAAGGPVAQIAAAPNGAARLSALAAGTYFVRVHSPAGELLREYVLTVTE